MVLIQLGNEKLVSPDKDLQQRFELAVKRADHLQEQVSQLQDITHMINLISVSGMVRRLDMISQRNGTQT